MGAGLAALSTSHPFAHAERRMTSCSIVGEEFAEGGRPNP
jgi:hypothetical protein